MIASTIPGDIALAQGRVRDVLGPRQSALRPSRSFQTVVPRGMLLLTRRTSLRMGVLDTR